LDDFLESLDEFELELELDDDDTESGKRMMHMNI